MTERPAGAVKLSLVIPTYNESRNLAELVGRLSAVLDACLSGAYELLVVDDDSPAEAHHRPPAGLRDHAARAP